MSWLLYEFYQARILGLSALRLSVDDHTQAIPFVQMQSFFPPYTSVVDPSTLGKEAELQLRPASWRAICMHEK